jgi:hypothetical protein
MNYLKPRSGLLLCLYVLCSAVLLQAQSQLVPLVTNKTPMPLSNKFSPGLYGNINQEGDFVFMGRTSSAVFLRRAGSSAPIRLYQTSEEVLGYPGSRGGLITDVRINDSMLAYSLDFALQNGENQGIIFAYDLTSASVSKLVSGLDYIPGSTTTTYGRELGFIGLNASSAIAFSAPLAGPGVTPGTTIFIKPAGLEPAAIVSLGDTLPDIGQAIFITPVSFNDRGEVLFLAGTSNQAGYFIGSIGQPIKKVATSLEGHGVPISGILNNNGEVAYATPDRIIWLYSGTDTRQVVASLGTPAPETGSFSYPSAPLAFNDNGDIIFTSMYGSNVLDFGLFRVRTAASDTFETVANRHQQISGDTRNFIGFSSVSMNNSGVVGFRSQIGWGVGGDRSYGMFRQTGTNLAETLAINGSPAPSSLGGTFSLDRSSITGTLDDGKVWFRTELIEGNATYAEILGSSGGPDNFSILMSTADDLPEGKEAILRTFRPGAAGNYVGFLAQRAGGALSIAVHNIVSHNTELVATELESIPALNGGKIRFNTINTVFINSNGTVVFGVNVTGGLGNAGNAILAKDPGQPIRKVVVTGDPVPGMSGVSFTGVNLSSALPIPLNDNGQVLFRGTFYANSAGQGLYRVTGSTVETVAQSGMPASDGAVFNYASDNFSVNDASINQSGQVAFLAKTGNPAVPGIYIWNSGAPLTIARVGDPSIWGDPWGGMYAPVFNDNGTIIFIAGIASQGGLLTASYSSPTPTPILTGAISLGELGTVTDANYRDFAINNAEVIIGRVDLTGGTADSAYMVRRGAQGLFQTPVVQGQSAPGTINGTFTTLLSSRNNYLSELIAIDPDGHIAFVSEAQDMDGTRAGIWHIKPDNSIEAILVRGILAPAFGGGAAVSSAPSSRWNSGQKYSFWARITGGTFTDGIFLFVPPAPEPTPAGTDVSIAPVDQTTGTTPVQLDFASVSTPGETTVTSSAAGPEVTGAFRLGDTPTYYDITTTAVFSGPIEVCVDIPAGFPEGVQPSLLHYENEAWVNVTTLTTATQVCGVVTSLSPFVVAAIPAIALEVEVTPNVLWPPNNKMVSITANITVSHADPDAQVSVELVSITSDESLDSSDIRGAIFGTDSRSFQLRAKRLGSGDGRIYEIKYRAIDLVNNYSVERTVSVLVPHDHRK